MITRKNARECKRLFGDLVVYMATMTDPARLDLTADLMDRVHDHADRLLALRGQVPEQHAYIQRLPFTDRLVLCMWLMDTDLATKLVRTTVSKAAG